MNINELVPDYKTCMEAKELGFPQNTIFAYDERPKCVPVGGNSAIPEDYTAAPILQEAVAKFGRISVLIKRMPDGQYGVVHPEQYKRPAFVTNPAQAALELWIKLKKDGVI